jgi:hypothetical protein
MGYDWPMKDVDVWRAANKMIEMHSLDAVWRAGLRADHFLSRGDVQGSNVWKQIVASIKEIQRAAPSHEEYRH